MDNNLLIAMLLIFCGSFIQSATGFGLAVVAAPILIHLSPEFIPGPIIIVALFLAVINALKYRANISFTGLKQAVIGRIPGTIAGAALLYYIDVAQLSLLLGTVVLMAVVVSLLPVKLEPTPRRLFFAGFLSGFFGSSAGIGGPPMALLMQHQQANLIRGNMAAFFVVGGVMSLLVQIPIGYMTLSHLYLSLPLLPAGYLGYRVALLVVDRLSQQLIRRMSLLLCTVSGAGAFYSGLTSLAGS
ncbi:sulfite exporter TauE/SafE family protein [Psychromonas sp.]|uniref:sulfite exporter TauE/SafE family protein n=1 Tax=Psychromonas sp. TaxID=1884585 RepID=UPI003569152D